MSECGKIHNQCFDKTRLDLWLRIDFVITLQAVFLSQHFRNAEENPLQKLIPNVLDGSSSDFTKNNRNRRSTCETIGIANDSKNKYR